MSLGGGVGLMAIVHVLEDPYAGRVFDVVFTSADLASAERFGQRRQAEAVESGRLDRHGFQGDGDEAHELGVIGEDAVCWALGTALARTINTFSDGGDIGDRIQVRSRRMPRWAMIVRPSDRETDLFVLVTRFSADTYRVWGWCSAEEVKRGDRGRWGQAYVGYVSSRPDAWWVEPTDLRPLHTLPADVTQQLPSPRQRAA